MGQALSFAEGVCAGLSAGGDFCGGAHQILNNTSTLSALITQLKRLTKNPNARLVGACGQVYLDAPLSPVLERLKNMPGHGYLRGRTYVIWARAENGKSAALQDFIENHLDNDRDGLYINVRKSINIVEAIQKQLSTTCDSGDIAAALVSALSTKGVSGPRRPKSFLIIDEVNVSGGRSLEPAVIATMSFIQDLFQTIADDRSITCIIASNRQETASALVKLNGGKIIPHPRFTSVPWQQGQEDIEWADFDWTVPQLEALLRLKHPTATISFDFLQDQDRHGISPGAAISAYEALLDQAILMPSIVPAVG
jgi:hypothetical protein